MKEIYIRLTKPQIRKLDPIWEQVNNAWHDDKRGGVLGIQPRESGLVSCVFVPQHQANRILKILKELE